MFWTVLKGKADKDPHKAMIVRAEFAVPSSKEVWSSGHQIGGAPIEFGSQIAEQLEMRLGALFGPVDKDPEAARPARPSPCRADMAPPPKDEPLLTGRDPGQCPARLQEGSSALRLLFDHDPAAARLAQQASHSAFLGCDRSRCHRDVET
jgi:hypothetical protein